MGSPDDVIKVDTEQLRSLSKGYDSRSTAVNSARNDFYSLMVSIISGIPSSYDGRLREAANADAADSNKQVDGFFGGFKEDSASLIKISEAFEEIDGQTIRIFQDADEITMASLADAGYNFGDNTTFTQTIIPSPPGVLPESNTTITVVRTINPDGSVTIRTTVQTVIKLDATTAANWNATRKDIENFTKKVFPWMLGLASPIAAAIWKAYECTYSTYTNHNPSRELQEGDVLTTTVTTVSTESPSPPEGMNPAWTEAAPPPEVTIRNEIEDADGNTLCQDEYMVDPQSGGKLG